MPTSLPTYPRISERVNHPLIPSITHDRLNLFYSANYASQDLHKLLDRERIDDEKYIRMSYWSAEGMDKPTFEEGKAELGGPNAKPLRKGHLFGPSWSNHWVKVDLTIPELLRDGTHPVIFEFDPSSEGLFFTPDGLPLHAITGGKNTEKDGGGGMQEDRRVEHIIPPKAVNSGTYQLYIEVSCNGMFGVGVHNLRYTPPDMERTFSLCSADLVVPHVELRALWTDFRILQQVSQSGDITTTSSVAPRALKACNDIMNAWRCPDDVVKDPQLLDDSVKRCRDIAWRVLGTLDTEELKKLAPSNPDFQHDANVWAVGHCHIDTAWLWRYTQTQQKVARSWTTQCDIMDRWPNHHFAASSAQQYLWLETLYPSGFERVKAYVVENRFHPVGGAWLEHDCMIPSGESLVRQYLHGQRYFKSRFGNYCREAWLPDTFGYASQLPQILRLAEMEYFFTQKISWNNINVFPYTSFNWVALDGSQILAHMTPVDSYNGQCSYPEMLKAMHNNKNLDVADECLYLFGNGDGGGGPTPGMLEKLERLSSLAVNNGGVPGMKLAKPSDFFDHLLQKTYAGETLPTWRGELYLEYHRGTYTTQANVKLGNRTMEQKLQALEYFATMASLQNQDYQYPKSDIEEIWHDVMLNQFHDVLPGTTISLVVKDVLEIYERRITQTEEMIEKALSALGYELLHSSPTSLKDLVVLDPLRLGRSHQFTVNGQAAILSTDKSGIGSLAASGNSGNGTKAYKDGDRYILEDPCFRMVISAGRITSLVDLQLDRELILPGPGASSGGLIIYEDYPLKYDAWDVEIYHLDSVSEIRFDKVEIDQGNLRSSLIATAKSGKSEIEMNFSLDGCKPSKHKESRSLFSVEVKADWHERHKVLRFALPVDIHCQQAQYGTQFGLIERPTHRNTTLEQAKFEVCGHMLADLSENGYGVALASSHKYGWAIEGNTMRMSMLRSPTTPDPETDQGRHQFSFAIMPHIGRLNQETFNAARAFTNPVYVCAASKEISKLPEFEIVGDQCQNVVLETIKRAEDDAETDPDALILRMYESLGGKAKGKLRIFGVNVKSCQWVNILEEPFKDGGSQTNYSHASVEGVDVDLDFRCYEIKTLRVELGS